MKNSNNRLVAVGTALWLALTVQLSAQPTVFTYQGRVTAGGANFTGAGQFKFALVTSTNASSPAAATALISGGFVTIINVTSGGNGYVAAPVVTISGGGGSGAIANAIVSGGAVTAINIPPGGNGFGYTTPPSVSIAPPPTSLGYTTHWSNDGTSNAGSEPAAAAAINVTDGLFSVKLGDNSLVNMQNISSDVFNQTNLQLRIWFNDRVNGFAVLDPVQDLTPAPFAIRAASLSGTVAASQITGTLSQNNIGPGSITSVMLATGAVSSNQLAADAVTTAVLAPGAVTPTKLASIVTNWLAVAIGNPIPAVGDNFGISLAAFGSDRLLVGAPGKDTGAIDAGAAYLFNTSGGLLTAFANPTPEESDNFGWSVAGMGNDHVVIGARGDKMSGIRSGVAYLFSTDGTLLNTLAKPSPLADDLFGYAVAAVGNNGVLIGAPGDDTSAANAGTAYLFSSNGTLLTTFINPTPVADDSFGLSVAALGNDRVLIGAFRDDTSATDAGAAYLYRTDGTLLTTFTNPTPASGDAFGQPVTAVGSDRVLIGAMGDNTGASGAGAAYLFSTNGTLISTFINPTSAGGDYFGSSVAAVGSNRVLIGAHGDNLSAKDAGAAYLFSTNGALLTTFANPTPATDDSFGITVAAAGGHWVLIGAYGDNTGAADSGAAYLFSTDTFAEGLVADAVRIGGVATASLQDGAVTLPKLDPSIGVWTRSDDNVFRPAGNVGIGTNSPNESLVVAGNIYATGTITPNSDQNLKTAFEPVDATAVLEKVSQLSIQQWRFKAEPQGVKHVGPMAQEFRAAFGLGAIPTAIATVDADGVALAAIQGLNQKLEAELHRRDVENIELKRQSADLLKRLEAIEARLR